MKFIGLSTCDTARKARVALEGAGITLEVTDVRKDGLRDDDIAAIVAAHGDKAINRASTTWRGLSEAERARPAAELLRDHPTLMKRPAIFKDGQWYLGWKPDVQAAVLK
ncbi:arsenate reductase [Ketogulonicigenium robustum]|uniref:Arsenate reductase n=1 Tax=Ketogulonicigenium robustum TaxID=92947 RepID=A0A1W6NXW2_9RHOB|nr:ArsC/Spx/MgsR family protein [Ketogulonicigenium robustum]ARO13930.1 arsenate reductase [Ketogulonicigenium robustum]